MSKQEEIREGIIHYLKGTAHNGYYKGLEDCVLQYLHSQGLEIVKYPKQGDDLTGTHIVWSEPLIKEVKHGS